MFVCYTSDQPCWTRKANTNNNHNKWLHEFLISLRWGNHNSLLCRCCHLTSQQPLEFTIDTSKITFYYVSLIKKILTEVGVAGKEDTAVNQSCNGILSASQKQQRSTCVPYLPGPRVQRVRDIGC